MAIALAQDCPMLPSHRRLFCVAPVKLDVWESKMSSHLFPQSVNNLISAWSSTTLWNSTEMVTCNIEYLFALNYPTCMQPPFKTNSPCNPHLKVHLKCLHQKMHPNCFWPVCSAMDPGSPTNRAHVAETVKERVDVGTSNGW